MLFRSNDTCPELVALYRGGATDDLALRSELLRLADAWEALTETAELYAGLRHAFANGAPAEIRPLVRAHAIRLRAVAEQVGLAGPEAFLDRVERGLGRKFDRMASVEQRVGRRLSDEDLDANVEGAVRAALYGTVRDRYNVARAAGRHGPGRAADFLFLRELAYAAMFRFNARGGFNVPYGGVSYNRKSLREKVDHLFGGPMRARLAATRFHEGDFADFLAAVAPEPGDFVFVDPPYDSDFSAYDGRSFGASDQVRLRDALLALPSRVMVVIKATPAIRALYTDDRWWVREAAKTYPWTIKSRNDRRARHLTITSYDPAEAEAVAPG